MLKLSIEIGNPIFLSIALAVLAPIIRTWWHRCDDIPRCQSHTVDDGSIHSDKNDKLVGLRRCEDENALPKFR
jgi:hypothetical protein